MTAPLSDSSPENQAPQDASRQSHADTRRSLLKRSLAAGPVILTVASTPVLGATCQSLSSGLSGNLSRPNAGAVTCTGLATRTWRSSINNDNNTFAAAATSPTCKCNQKFSDFFVGGPTSTLKTVLSAIDSNSNDFKAHMVGALLNIRAQKVPATVLDENKLKGLWLEIKNTGYYQPFGSTAKRWSPAQVVEFLQNQGIA